MRRFFSQAARGNQLSQSNKELLLLSLDWTRKKDPPMSLGQASLVAKLRGENIPVRAKSWSVNHDDFKVADALAYVMAHAGQGTDLAMGAYVWHEPHTQALLAGLKQENFPGRIIMGGPQVSYTRSGLAGYYPQVDVFIRGYGEDALTQLWHSPLEKPVIAGVHYAGEPDLGLSARVDLDQLPSPYLTGVIQPQPFIRWETQRGCPFRCAFCQHRESDVTMKRRQHDYSRIMQEAAWILDHPIISDIAVLDPTFNSGPHYMDILEQFITRGYRGKLALQCRIEMVNDAFLDAVSALNQTGEVVLEFGLQTIHPAEEKIIQRPNNKRKVQRILAETYQRGIQTEVSLIFGLPGQTVHSFHESIQFCKDLHVPTIYAYPLMLLRGTPLYAAKDRLGLVESDTLDLEIDRIQSNIPHVVASPSFTYEDWETMAAMAEGLDAYNQKHKPAAVEKMKATLQETAFFAKRSSQAPASDVSVGIEKPQRSGPVPSGG